MRCHPFDCPLVSVKSGRSPRTKDRKDVFCKSISASLFSFLLLVIAMLFARNFFLLSFHPISAKIQSLCVLLFCNLLRKRQIYEWTNFRKWEKNLRRMTSMNTTTKATIFYACSLKWTQSVIEMFVCWFIKLWWRREPSTFHPSSNCSL